MNPSASLGLVLEMDRYTDIKKTIECLQGILKCDPEQSLVDCAEQRMRRLKALEDLLS